MCSYTWWNIRKTTLFCDVFTRLTNLMCLKKWADMFRLSCVLVCVMFFTHWPRPQPWPWSVGHELGLVLGAGTSVNISTVNVYFVTRWAVTETRCWTNSAAVAIVKVFDNLHYMSNTIVSFACILLFICLYLANKVLLLLPLMSKQQWGASLWG